MTLFDLLSLKNDVNVPLKSNKQKKQDPDPLVRVIDPRIRIRIRIRTEVSWIRNIGFHPTLFGLELVRFRPMNKDI